MKTQKDVTLRLQNLQNKLEKDNLDVAEQIGIIKRLSMLSTCDIAAVEELEKRLGICVKEKNYKEVREILWFLQ